MSNEGPLWQRYEPEWRESFRRDPFFSPSHDPAHDYLHLERVVGLSKWIAQQENAELEIVVPAAWFHDVVPIPKNDLRRAQASELCAAEAGRRLRNQDFGETTIAKIQTAILEHSFSRGLVPSTLESRVVQDADRLDALGAIGIARCFSTAGSLKRAFYSEEDPFCDGQAPGLLRTPNDTDFTLDHFYTKLLRLETTFQTKAGRVLAQRRTAVLHEYLTALRTEIQETQSLNRGRTEHLSWR